MQVGSVPWLLQIKSMGGLECWHIGVYAWALHGQVHSSCQTPCNPLTLATRSPFDVETKQDASPVTIADKQAETAMRELLNKVRSRGHAGGARAWRLSYNTPHLEPHIRHQLKCWALARAPKHSPCCMWPK